MDASGAAPSAEKRRFCGLFMLNGIYGAKYAVFWRLMAGLARSLIGYSGKVGHQGRFLHSSIQATDGDFKHFRNRKHARANARGGPGGVSNRCPAKRRCHCRVGRIRIRTPALAGARVEHAKCCIDTSQAIHARRARHIAQRRHDRYAKGQPGIPGDSSGQKPSGGGLSGNCQHADLIGNHLSSPAWPSSA